MRKATAAMLAVPILAFVSVAALLRRSAIARGTLAIGMALSLGIGLVAVGQPAATVATPPTAIVPLSEADFTTAVATNQGVTEAVSIRFSAPMDHRSVAAAVRVEPATSTALSWDASSTVLTVAPADHWMAGTFHTVSVQAGALAASGQPLARPARAVFLTRAATPVSAAATDQVGTRVSTTSSFVVSFPRPVDPATVSTAMRLDPPAAGTVVPVVRPGDMPDGPVEYRFIPDAPLQPNAAYRLIVSGVRDLDGLPLDTLTLAVQTASAASGPTVVRFRPAANARNVARDAAISVRFTDRMDRRSTASALTVGIGGRPVAGNGPLGRVGHGPRLHSRGAAAVCHDGACRRGRRRPEPCRGAARGRRARHLQDGRQGRHARPNRDRRAPERRPAAARPSVAGAGERSRPTTSG